MPMCARCAVGLPTGVGSNFHPVRGGSGYEQPSAKLYFVEIDEVAVALRPPA